MTPTRLLPALLTFSLLLTACAGKPAPDWQINAKDATERAGNAYLAGNTRVADQEFQFARNEVARTGRIDLLARVELTRCAAQVASLVLDGCTEFEKLRLDAPAAEVAYANYLAGKIQSSEIAQLPAQQRAIAGASSDSAAASAMLSIEDPLSRLVAAGVLLQGKRASPAVIGAAVETASAQGWRRPLLAWLGVQAMRAEQAGDMAEAQRLRRKMTLVEKPF
ncbi:hypothetical protein ACFQPC_03975 [Herminiimonas glaciei]|uniref:Lipoprotein n=1 Tax=Herminiimonas glaciei TaxID=523788 RepID=A0ABW2I872_9BURK